MRSERYPRLPEPIVLDRESREPLHRQISRYFRRLIAAGKITAGMLPSSRVLARELGCSRNTVVLAYEQLAAEGFFSTKLRSSTVILSPARVQHDEPRPGSGGDLQTSPLIAGMGRKLAGLSKPDLHRFTDLSPVPNFDIFPFKTWARLYRETWHRPARDLLLDREPKGFEPLRAALADHLRLSRGLACDARNIVITSGTTQSLALIMNCLLEPHDSIWIENPCFAEAIVLLRLSSLDIHPIPVDEHGISVEEGVRRCPDARLSLVAPAHHFPLGMTMSLERRLELLAWAGRSGAWIVEDDYDSELIWATRSIPALQTLSPDYRVIYLGSFSKSLLPNLRIGYIVAHEEVANTLGKAKVFFDGPTSMQLQPVLAKFISEGYLARHLSRAVSSYARQRERALARVKRHLGKLVALPQDQRGIHITVEFTGPASRIDDGLAVAECEKHGLTLRRLSQFYVAEPRKNGLVFGFANASDKAFEQSMAQIAKVLRALLRA